jgi:4-oxalmesaconate hydratase
MSQTQPLIIDCHGHYTTAPLAMETWRNAQIAAIKDPGKAPKASDLKISDDELRESIELNQLKLMKQRGSDITLFSPRASFMAHHIGDFQVSATWAAICNELCYRVAQLFPDNFVPVAMLPQSTGVDPATCIPEIVKCVEQYGNVGINLNPDPSGGHWKSPPLTDRHWYPIYEKMVEYDIPGMVHVSTSCNACFHTTGAHYIMPTPLPSCNCWKAICSRISRHCGSWCRTAAAQPLTTGGGIAAWPTCSKSRFWKTTCSTTFTLTRVFTTSPASIC